MGIRMCGHGTYNLLAPWLISGLVVPLAGLMQCRKYSFFKKKVLTRDGYIRNVRSNCSDVYPMEWIAALSTNPPADPAPAMMIRHSSANV